MKLQLQLKLVLIVGLFLAANYQSVAMASSPGGTDSCGLGWSVTSSKSLVGTSTRGTTNGTVPPTFGMTSGTSNCDAHSIVQKEMDAVRFVAMNVEPLAVDMASGSGEYIDALAMAMGCHESAPLGAAIRENLQNLLPSKKLGGIEFYKSLRGVVRSNPALAVSCPNAV